MFEGVDYRQLATTSSRSDKSGYSNIIVGGCLNSLDTKKNVLTNHAFHIYPSSVAAIYCILLAGRIHKNERNCSVATVEGGNPQTCVVIDKENVINVCVQRISWQANINNQQF